MSVGIDIGQSPEIDRWFKAAGHDRLPAAEQEQLLSELETFCQFITNPGRDFRYSAVENPASVKEIVLEPAYQEMCARDRDAHTESHTAARGKNRHADVIQQAKH